MGVRCGLINVDNVPVEVAGAACYCQHMLEYFLQPIDLDDPNWRSSSHNNACRVHAASEEEARRAAHAEFWVASERDPATGEIGRSPWLDDDLTKSTELPVRPDEYREGQIEIPTVQSTSRGDVATETVAMLMARGWLVVKGGKPPPLQQHGEGPGAARGGYAEQTLPRFRSGGEGHVDSEEVRNVDLSAGIAATAGIAAEAEVTRRSEITQQTVTYVIQNREVIGGQASLLLRLLDGLDGLDDDPNDRRNYSLRDALGLSVEINENELSELLRALRDEVRLLRETLENQSVNPTTLEQLRDIGLDNLRALNRNHVFITMEAVGLGSVLWTLLSSLGVMDTNLAMEALRLILDR